MKKIILLIIIIIQLIIPNVFSQCDDLTRYTPLMTPIKACSSGGWPDEVVEETDTYTRSFAIEVYDDGTNDYNCHGYAWNVDRGGDEVWINNLYTESSNVDNYWMDGSYIELNSQPASTGHVKVFYGSNNFPEYLDDHSAVTTSNSNVFISKMGCGVRCSHLKSNSPYDYSDLKYFELLKVASSANFVCYGNNITLTTPDYANCSFTWTYSTNLLNYVSGQGTNTFTVTPKYSSTSGHAYISLTLTIGSPVNETRSISKTIAVNMPNYDDLELALLTTGGSPVSYMCPNTHYHIFLNNSGGCSLSNYSWSIPAGWTENYTWNNMVSVYTGTSPGGMVEVYADACNSVNSKVITDYFGSGYCGQFLMVFSPNPTTDETTLSIESTSEEKVLDENEEWELEIYNNTQILKDKKTKIRGNQYKLKTSGWKEGIYFVRVKYKDEILQGKLVVK